MAGLSTLTFDAFHVSRTGNAAFLSSRSRPYHRSLYHKLRESIAASCWPTAPSATANQSWTIGLYQCSRASSWHGLPRRRGSCHTAPAPSTESTLQSKTLESVVGEETKKARGSSRATIKLECRGRIDKGAKWSVRKKGRSRLGSLWGNETENRRRMKGIVARCSNSCPFLEIYQHTLCYRVTLRFYFNGASRTFQRYSENNLLEYLPRRGTLRTRKFFNCQRSWRNRKLWPLDDV